MAKISAKSAVITCDDSGGSPQTISTDVESFEVQYAIDAPEATGFSEGSHNFVPGQRVVGITLNVYWNTAATTGAMTVLRGIIGSATSKTVSIQPEGTGLALSGEFMLTGIQPTGTPAGVIKLGACKFVVMGSSAPAWA
jgi:hypothetical protein